MINFRKNYFILTVILFLVEVFIALFVKDRFIRPYAGDFLVVILIYCFIRSFFNVSIIKTAIGVLLFAFTIEGLQYINFVKMLGWQNSKLAYVVLGNSFSWMDMITYVLGIGFVLVCESLNNFLKSKKMEDQKATISLKKPR